MISKHLRIPEPTEHWGTNLLREAIQHLPVEKGQDSQEIRRFDKVSINGAGRVLSREDVIRGWFSRHVQEYVEYLLAQRKSFGWADILSISTPLRPDRLLLTLGVDGPDPIVFYSWAAAREGWAMSSPLCTERRILISPPPQVLRSFWAGHSMGVKERFGMTEVAPLPGLPKYRFLPEFRATPYQTSCDPQDLEAQRPRSSEATVRLRAAPQTSPVTYQLPDGREATLVDWDDVTQPLGRRVQSKLISQAVVDVEQGVMRWADAETLAKFPGRGVRVPGALIRNLYAPTEFGRVILNRPQLLWAYWAGEVPIRTARETNQSDQVRKGGIDGVYNLLASGWKAGSIAESELFAGKEYNGGGPRWRTIKGEDSIPVIGPAVSVRLSATESITKSRSLMIAIARLMAKRVLRGDSSIPAAYETAYQLHEYQDDWRPAPLDPETDYYMPSKDAKIRYAWLTEDERRELLQARLETKPYLPGSSTLTGHRKAEFVLFPESWVNIREWRHHLIQQTFREVLGSKAEDPASYGKEPVDMYELAISRGMQG